MLSNWFQTGAKAPEIVMMSLVCKPIRLSQGGQAQQVPAKRLFNTLK